MGASGRSLRNERLSPIVPTLLALLRHPGETGAAEGMPPLATQAWDEMLDLARRHGVTPLLHRALQARGLILEAPDSIRTRLEEDRRATALDNLRNYGEFRRIAQALRDGRIPVIALKGLHLAELVYRDISLRPMSDLDILVPVSELTQAITTVYDLGYGFDKDLSETANAMLDKKYDVELIHRRAGNLLEVHWSLGEPPRRYVALIDEIWRRAVPASIGDADALVMAPEFLLLHVCAHLSCHHVFAFSLRALCDIAEIVREHPSLDWSVLVDRSQRCGWGRGVAAALRLASDQLRVAVPAEVLTALSADALDSDMLADAMEHLLTYSDVPNDRFELHHAVNLKAFAGKRGTAEKLATVWKRIFVPRAELAMCYGVPQHSARLSLYYAVRLKDLIRRYAASAWALNVSDPRLAATAARHARLAKWIGGG